MKIHHPGLAAIGMCVAMICGGQAYAQNQTPGVGDMNTQQQYRGPHKDIDDAASQVKPEDENSIRVLAKAVFDFPHSFPHMDTAVEAVTTDRLVKAEKAYLQKQRSGVQEQTVVDVINGLADKFAVPDYAKTSALQVRYLRMTEALTSPNFMGRGVARPDAKIGDSVNPEMSPIQAAHLMLIVIDQKFVNPDYQIPPAEWDQGYPGLTARLQGFQDAQNSGAPRTSHLVARANPKRRELSDIVWKGLSSLSADDGLQLINKTFTTLGI
jgi:hypothetical protein